MKFSTIWTMPAMSTMERLRRTRDWAAMEIAAHLPLRVRYWATILEIAKVTTQKLPNEEVPAISLDQILTNLDAPKSLA
jgi:hypothetical protein